jgi:hypothetical protein
MNVLLRARLPVVARASNSTSEFHRATTTEHQVASNWKAWTKSELNVDLLIDRLTLLGIPLELGEHPLLQATVGTELTNLLASGGLSDALKSGIALDTMRTVDIQLSDKGGAVGIGEQIAQAVYAGIGK